MYRPATMAEIVGRGTSRERFALVLMGTFALVAVALAALGLYGVLAYTVRQRSTEIGIRIALGATAAHVRALVFRQAALVAGVGVAAGSAVRWPWAAGSAPLRSGSPLGSAHPVRKRGLACAGGTPRGLVARTARRRRRASPGHAERPLMRRGAGAGRRARE